jgi:Leucine-rich repeat (LRR) protein
MRTPSLQITLGILIFAFASHAAPPPELTTLQQQYAFAVAERVAAPYDTGAAALNEKFLAALTNAAAEAKKAGKLPEILAIDEDKKLILAKLPLPEADDEKTPESLKKLRGIYRAALAKLMEQRQAAHAALLPAYTARLQVLESTLTKGDRMEEAKEVLKYRDSIGTDLPPPAMAAATVTPPPTTATKSDEKASKVKGDDRKAAEWVLSLGNRHRLVIDDNKTIKSLPELPKGKLSIKIIEIDGRFLDAPVNGEIIQVLAGLQELSILKILHVPLSDGDFSFLSSLPALSYLEMSDNGVSDGVVAQLKACKSLAKLAIRESNDFTGATLGQLAHLKRLTDFSTFKTSLNDAGVAQIAEIKSLTSVFIEGLSSVTDAALPFLRSLPKLEMLYINRTSITPAGLASAKMLGIKALAFNEISNLPMRQTASVVAPAFPNVHRINSSFEINSAEDIAALASFPKLDSIFNLGTIKTEALAGLAELPKLALLNYSYAQHVTDDDLRQIVSSTKSIATLELSECNITDTGLLLLKDMKKLKRIQFKSNAVTDAGVAAFKKERPDVKVDK